MVKTFYRVRAGRDAFKSVVHLGEIDEIEGNMPFREMRWPETELAAGDAIIDEQAATFQMLEIPTDGGDKLKVAYIVLQAAPDVINVHRVPDSETRSTSPMPARPKRQRVG
ncbi:MAG TPA: hypothetical protein VG308_09070 [Stellaceae bacterium]|nr:hypothetical protein [Stellaceae bacterium]